jgi:hypothetical protein
MPSLRTWAALAALIALAATLVVAASAGAEPGAAPWTGKKAFKCKVQDVGTGTDFPRPKADPFCVRFDKTNQNVTDFGLAEFLSKEPARTAAASPKCFYFQEDHWRGSIVQGSEPELWHWRGRYFFDKALGIGGVAVHRFRVGGVPMDPSPYAPDFLKPYMYPRGGGGAIFQLEGPADPQCAKKVDTSTKRRHVYRLWYRRAFG